MNFKKNLIFFYPSVEIGGLTKNLFGLREGLKKYINPLILKTKIIFVVLVFFIVATILS